MTKAPRHCPASLRQLVASLAFLLLLLPALAQQTTEAPSPTQPLPQETGAAGLKEMLLRLQTTARLMQTTAHPDDEDGGMLTLESRGKGVTITLLTLNRGEGGQNKIGSNLFDVLGVVRTLELTAADRYYGVEQRFTRVADFGFSKSAEETFQKWGGHDIALGDMVRVIRTFRPDVLVARFSGTPRDGHGHHQASSILTQEAFRAAADPNRFPEQIMEGMLPWQAKKLYIGNVCPFFAQTCPDKDYTLKLNTGEESPALGMSYIQFAMEGLRHQLSQGAGGWHLPPGPHFTFYRLLDSVLPPTTDKDGHENDFFDGIDTSLPALASRLGKDEKSVPWLRPELEKFSQKVKAAATASGKSQSDAAAPLLEGLAILGDSVGKIERSSLPASEKLDLLTRLRQKQQQCRQAVNLALNISIEAEAANSAGGSPVFATPGHTLAITAKFTNGSPFPLRLTGDSLQTPEDWRRQPERHHQDRVVQPGASVTSNFDLKVPENAGYTRPYWHRDNPETESINLIDNPRYVTLPFPPPSFHVEFSYELNRPGGAACGQRMQNSAATVVMSTVRDDEDHPKRAALAVAPVFSVMLEPGEQVIPVEEGAATSVKVAVTAEVDHAPAGSLRLDLPAGWRAEPAELPVELSQGGQSKDYRFQIFPASLKQGRTQLHAVLAAGGAKYSEGFSVVTREDLNTFYYYQPAVQRVSIVDVKVPKHLRVGYIMGAGDDIPTVLQQIGINLAMIPAEKLAGEDLSQFGTIVLGIRAYDTQKDVAANNKKLLEFVSSGGTLVVQYNAGTSEFNSGHFTPYPAELSRDRVTVEEAPVEILDPADSIFHDPNQITQKDFDGWVQERGLYFMDQWDDHFKPLLACQDPGEAPQKGGLLRAQYGKGTYIYTGYAFFRQLPAGVPGAIRLYVNLLSAGH